jgi:RNA polymerase sigma factor (TIGR02999 family)
MASRLKDVSVLLADWSQGNESARDELMPLVYNELRRLAGHYMKAERPGHSLQATALVNEAYLRLVDQRQVRWQGRAHFFALASQMMRRILVDYARRRRYAKRGGGGRQVELDEALIVSEEKSADVVALDDALTRLAAIAPRKSRVVELRYFGGLSMDEVAQVLNVSPVTVRRDWTTAKAWLYRAISGTGEVEEHAE